VKLSGDLATFPATDVMQLIASTRRNGLLVISASGCVRGILFVEGTIAWATSNCPGERTNEVLCRLDLADRAASLLRRMERADLFRRHVKKIVAGLVAEEQGTFLLFDSGHLPSPGTGLDTQRLLFSVLASPN